MPIQIVGAPWLEHGAGCVQIRIPQPDGSNLEPIVRLDPAELASQPDEVVADRLARAADDEVARHAAPSAAVPDALTRVLTRANGELDRHAPGAATASPLPQQAASKPDGPAQASALPRALRGTPTRPATANTLPAED